MRKLVREILDECFITDLLFLGYQISKWYHSISILPYYDVNLDIPTWYTRNVVPKGKLGSLLNGLHLKQIMQPVIHVCNAGCANALLS